MTSAIVVIIQQCETIHVLTQYKHGIWHHMSHLFLTLNYDWDESSEAIVRKKTLSALVKELSNKLNFTQHMIPIAANYVTTE